MTAENELETPPLARAELRATRRRFAVGRGWVIGLACALFAGGFFLGDLHGPKSPTARLLPSTLGYAAAFAGAQSSSWYCTGGMGNVDGTAISTVILDNANPTPVHGVLHEVGSDGTTKTVPVVVPANSQVVKRPGRDLTSQWVATTATLRGGKVTASLQVQGPSGWAITPCASLTSTSWYFASGSTQTDSSLYISLYNPNATLAVCDVVFYTAIGRQEPQPFEGLILTPGQVKVISVGEYVQHVAQIATVVTSVSGTVVASELSIDSLVGSSQDSLHTGTPALAHHWYVPSSTDTLGGGDVLVVANPSKQPAHVTVKVQAPSGPILPFQRRIAPGGAWQLNLATSRRVPGATPIAIEVYSTRGPGVVVDRTIRQAVTAGVPQAATPVAEVGSQVQSGSHRDLIPRITLTAWPATEVFSVVLYNPTATYVHVKLSSLTGGSSVYRLRTLSLRPHQAITLEKEFASIGAPILVEADGDLSVAGQVRFGAGQTPIDIPAIPVP